MEKAFYQKWLERVNYDMDTAEAMYATKRYIYAVFMCQQALEKCFKALMAFKGIGILPVHNLRRLAEMTGVVSGMSKEELKKMDFFHSIISTQGTKRTLRSCCFKSQMT
jgi:HEPN domain-containing protein